MAGCWFLQCLSTSPSQPPPSVLVCVQRCGANCLHHFCGATTFIIFVEQTTFTVFVEWTIFAEQFTGATYFHHFCGAVYLHHFCGVNFFHHFYALKWIFVHIISFKYRTDFLGMFVYVAWFTVCRVYPFEYVFGGTIYSFPVIALVWFLFCFSRPGRGPQTSAGAWREQDGCAWWYWHPVCSDRHTAWWLNFTLHYLFGWIKSSLERRAWSTILFTPFLLSVVTLEDHHWTTFNRRK